MKRQVGGRGPAIHQAVTTARSPTLLQSTTLSVEIPASFRPGNKMHIPHPMLVARRVKAFGRENDTREPSRKEDVIALSARDDNSIVRPKVIP